MERKSFEKDGGETCHRHLLVKASIAREHLPCNSGMLLNDCYIAR